MAQTPINSPDITSNFDPMLYNGNIFCNVYLPDEILTLILSFVDIKMLIKQCRFVCKRWCVLIKGNVWKVKAERQQKKMFDQLALKKRLPWSVYHSIAGKNPFGKNLLKNHCGQNQIKHWRILQNGGNQWKVEKPPIGVPNVLHPEDYQSCFVTSFDTCEKSQLIDLPARGIHADILDKYQPDIIVSENFAGRWDCTSTYYLTVKLLSYENKVLKQFDFEDIMDPVKDGWQKVSHKFESYGPGVRYVLFTHSGKDLRWWSGHYGSKMSNARVEIPSGVLAKFQICDNEIEF